MNRFFQILFALTIVVLLCACSRSVSRSQTVSDPEPSLSDFVMEEPEASSSPQTFSEPLPTPEISFTIAGQHISAETASVDLSQASVEEIDRLISVLPSMSQLRSINLGQAAAETPSIPWDRVFALRVGLPQADITYSFTVQGYPFSLSDEILNLNHIIFSDEGVLAAQIASCMKNLRILDMDCCGVSNESMAGIRDRLPNVDVVWRVWIGSGYSTRTNETRLVISNPDRGGDLNTPESIEGLKYCTKVKYLDLGHNYLMTDISFVQYMPDLEVLIIAMTAIKDISPLVTCTKLNYLEYQTSAACDLSPLSELKNLKDLNICYNFALRDIRPIYSLDLDRLFVGCLSPIPPDQITEYKRLHPNCIVNDYTEDPTARGWRVLDEYYPPVYAPRYEQLRQEMNYDNFPGCYAYIGNDQREFGLFEY